MGLQQGGEMGAGEMLKGSLKIQELIISKLVAHIF